jgi:hypothetical protein
MESTKRKIGLSDMDILNTILTDIWKLGDRDEMSIKHIGHGLAAYVATGDSGNRADYETPDIDMTDRKLKKLESLWKEVEGFLSGVSREECVSVFRYLPIAVYGSIYLDETIWPEYADRRAKIERVLSNAEDRW